MGGMGNRLFQIARAFDLEQEGYSVSVVNIEEFTTLNNLAEKKLSWTQHNLWIDGYLLAKKLGLGIAKNTLALKLILYLELIKIKFMNKREYLNLPVKEDFRKVQVGYFQKKNCLSIKSINNVAASVFNVLHSDFDLKRYSKNAIIHIRGGDFSQTDRLSSQEVNKFINKFINVCECVTNDPIYVKKNYNNLPIYRGDNAKEDFIRIAKANAIYPSNSTFCFWASAIATRHYDAILLKKPSDFYWQYLNNYIQSSND